MSTESENIRKIFPLFNKNFKFFYSLNRDYKIEKENIKGKFIKIGSERPRIAYIVDFGEEAKHYLNLDGQNLDSSSYRIGLVNPKITLLNKETDISLILSVFSGGILVQTSTYTESVEGKWCLFLNAEKIYLSKFASFDLIGPFE